MTIRVTRKTARLLRIMLAVHTSQQRDPTFRVRNRTLMEKAEISVSGFHNLVRRLEGDGLVEGDIEVLPEGTYRPRHIYFQLTDNGAEWARQALAQYDHRPWRRIRKRTNS